MSSKARSWSPATLSGVLERIHECNVVEGGTYIPFHIEGQAVGYILPSFAERLCQFPEVFCRGTHEGEEVVLTSQELRTTEARTTAVGKVLQRMREEGIIQGWRDELYPVMTSFGDEPALLVERAAASRFGVTAYGVHVNGYVEMPDGSQEMWIARRSRSKPTWPGLLDHMVAGGQPHGLSPAENVLKECQEEAGVPLALASQAAPTGVVSYKYSDEEGLRRDVLFCYDLKLPEDFVPVPQDGEVEEFMRLPIAEVADTICNSKAFKPNCNLVIIDFLVRHGYITPEHPKYLQVLEGLRPPL
eukprot:CAMPEP_0118927806 /NCGR_PEP_ID=MMETSP1169-20130426/5205_1 /TAXON_ID=36882 /ORGANISM="Pyramimonas obovata, Strain CCMP722" /LENGTH=301 /DNA_ID=CAMNT_0006869653 /DNA_START=192 /DNA_END=1097 /DNA_ORIENTATION=-